MFGMVERGSGRALTFRVPDRTRETLVTRLVQEFIQPGTVIISEKFSPYFNLNDSYTHLMVNHSENFVHPYTGAHTNTIEGVWNAVKKKLKRMCGTFKHQLPGRIQLAESISGRALRNDAATYCRALPSALSCWG